MHGEESFFIDKLTDEFQENILSDMEKEFNQMVFYGKDATPANIVSSAKQYPMMAPYRVIVLREAQQMRDLASLESYVANPVDSTILVLAYKGKKIDMRTSFGKLLKKNGVVFESKSIPMYKISQWIGPHAKSLGINIDSKAVELISLLLGNNLSKIDNELQKLKIVLGDNKIVKLDDIRTNISLNREYSVFELNNALGRKDMVGVFSIIDVFGNNPKDFPLQYIIPVLYNYFTKVFIIADNLKLSDNQLIKMTGINQYFLKEYKIVVRNYSGGRLARVFDILHEYDLKSKGLGLRTIDNMELIKEMCLKILI